METAPTTKRPFFANIFLSPDEPRLRAGWRLLIQAVLMLALAMCFGLLLNIPLAILGIWGIGELIVLEFIELFAITLSVFLARRLLDKRTVASLGLKFNRYSLWDVLAGLLIAGLVMGLVYLLEWSLGWLTFEGYAWQYESPSLVQVNAAIILLTFIMVGWSEELLFRGYYLQNLASGLTHSETNPSGRGLIWGVILSTLVFSVLHLLNPYASWVSFVGIFLAGLFLAYGYLHTGQLWLSIGLHIGWNFFEGPVFGFPVSGMDFYRITRITVTGPELWTGGSFGPEAGLVVLPALALGALLVYGYTVVSRESGVERRELRRQ